MGASWETVPCTVTRYMENWGLVLVRTGSWFQSQAKIWGSEEVVCQQETHGCIGDLQTLEREVGSHRAFGSFDSSPGVGGVVILVAKQLVSQASLAICSTIQAARSIEITIAFQKATLQLINIHVDPAADH